MIRTIIIDDEAHCRERLEKLLRDHFGQTVEVTDTCPSVEEALASIRKHRPNLLMLDVQLQDQTGFDLLERLGNHSADVIFTTAYGHYAVEAFRFSALDYLLKPIDLPDLQRALGRALEKKESADTAAKLDLLLHNLRQERRENKRICLPVMNGMVFIQVSDIIRCESEVNYTHIYMSDGQKYLASRTLKEFEEMLADYNFVRVHNSHLVNLAHVLSYSKGKGGYITMSDQSTVGVSTRRREAFLRKVSGN